MDINTMFEYMNFCNGEIRIMAGRYGGDVCTLAKLKQAINYTPLASQEASCE